MEASSIATCTPEQVLSGGKTVVLTHCLTRGESVVLTLVAESFVASIVAVVWVLGIIWRNYVRVNRDSSDSQRLIQTPGDVFMLSLFLADLINAIGGTINIKWIAEGKVEIGASCTAQAAIQQIGATAVAMTTLGIAVHTFSAVWWGRGLYSTLNAAIVVGILWLCNFLFVVIGTGIHANRSDYYMTPVPVSIHLFTIRSRWGPTLTPFCIQYWCWIGPGYVVVRVLEEYAWFWLTLLVSLLAYVPLFFWGRGNITVNQRKWFKFHCHRSEDCADDLSDRRRALKLIAYPLIYSILIIPLSAVRWVEFIHGDAAIRPAAALSVFAIYALSGVCDVVLFVIIRPGLLLFSTDSTQDQAMGMRRLERLPSPERTESEAE